MKKLLVLAVVGLMASTANAGLLYMADMATGDLEQVVLAGPSDTAEIGLYYDIQGGTHADDPEVLGFVGVQFKDLCDTGCYELIYAQNFLVNDNAVAWVEVDREVGEMGVITPDPAPFGGGIQPSGYFLSAGDTPEYGGVGSTGRWDNFLMEVITIHCLEAWCDSPLYFDFVDGATSFQLIDNSDVPQWPFGDIWEYDLDDPNNRGVYFDVWNGRHPDHFSEYDFWPEDRPFMVVQLPEPASLALLAFGGLVLLRRR